MSIKILKTVHAMSIQDLGRKGHRDIGVPVSGVMDRDAFRIANLLCGNEPHFPAIELTLHGSMMMAEADCLIAHVGGGSCLYINGDPVPSGKPVWVTSFSVLEYRPLASGCRSYLAMAGGFSSQYVLDSHSTYVSAAMGGHEGRLLRQGDVLHGCYPLSDLSAKIAKAMRPVSNGWSQADWSIPWQVSTQRQPVVVRALEGPEWTWFEDVSRQAFLTSDYLISQSSSRMGYRLQGPAIRRLQTSEMISTAVSPGTVQVTHSGMLILLMADAQTVGGYPRIAHVFSADMGICGQLRPGDRVKFVIKSLAEAEASMLERERWFQEIEQGIRFRFRS